jgi:predicted phosphoribosyltransferase
MHFRDRADAGRQLAKALRARYGDRPDVLILALPRGGVPVAYQVSRILNVPLDIFVVRKLGVPGHEELAMGAIATGGAIVFNDEVVGSLGIPRSTIDRLIERERQELARRERDYRGSRPPPEVKGRTVILVDDGLATGASMHAAIEAVRALGPVEIVVAVPTAAASTCARLRPFVNDMVCVITPEPFHSVSEWYDDFSQTTDEEVYSLVSASSALRTGSEPRP